MAGLLTFSIIRLPSRPLSSIGAIASRRTVAGMPDNIREITAAGTVQDSHLVPYYPNDCCVRNHNPYKYRKNFLA
jgi:hypothetical protein